MDLIHTSQISQLGSSLPYFNTHITNTNTSCPTLDYLSGWPAIGMLGVILYTPIIQFLGIEYGKAQYQSLLLDEIKF